MERAGREGERERERERVREKGKKGRERGILHNFTLYGIMVHCACDDKVIPFVQAVRILVVIKQRALDMKVIGRVIVLLGNLKAGPPPPS